MSTSIRVTVLLIALAIVVGPAFAQENTREFQEKRREIEERFKTAAREGDLAGKKAAVEELRALGLPVPPETGSNENSGGSTTPGTGSGLPGDPANAGTNAGPTDPGLGTGGNQKPEEKEPAPFKVIVERADGKELTGDDAKFLVGEKIELRARVEAGEGGKSPGSVSAWRWTIPGSTIKSYSLDIEKSQSNIWEGRSTSGTGDMHVNTLELKVENLAEADLTADKVSFYWKDEGQARVVVVTAKIGKHEATGQAEIHVRRSDIPARELYTETSKFSGNWEILPNHSSWHSNFDGTHRFIYFHREFLRSYNVWRELFGYLPIEAVESTDQPGGGGPKPDYLTEAGGKTSSSQHGAKKLGDFASVSDLGDDLESPWHNQGHGVEASRLVDGDTPNGDMASVARAPKCEVFYMWHTKIDNVAKEYEHLKAAAATKQGG